MYSEGVAKHEAALFSVLAHQLPTVMAHACDIGFSLISSKAVEQNARRTSSLRQTESAFSGILVLGDVGSGHIR